MKTQRIRIAFEKTQAMRFTGHLDLRRAWERTFRRSQVPLAYSSGYTPRPQFNFAAPLPLGFLSTHELGDFWLEKRCDLDDIRNRLSRATPPGILIRDIQEIDALHGDKLPTLVTSAEYEAAFLAPLPSLPKRVTSFLSQERSIRERKGSKYDLAPLVHDLQVISENDQGQQRLSMDLALRPGATGRPDEVILELGGDPHHCLITRTRIHLQK